MMSKDYGSWSLADIKNELRKRNAKVTGKKAVLVQRLNDYDALFGPVVNEPEAVYHIQTPEAQQFKDVNSDSLMAPLTEEELEVFCVLAERDDLTTGKNMYDEGFLLTARSTNDKTDCYVVATCASEMRKQVSYKVVIKYEAKTIKETQCECAAGLGPYAQCKHVIMVLYALVEFSKSKIMKTRPSCTSNLQNFHHPTKFYTGSPVEARNIKLKTETRSLDLLCTWDPRPTTTITKEKYVENFRNEIVNFCSSNKVSMPIAQLFVPANKKALYKDHDYLEKTFEEEYLEKLILDESELKELEETTRNNKKIWKKQRLLRLQSSNFSKICKSRNMEKLAKSLLKNTDIMTVALKHGIKYEAKAIEEFKKKTGLCVVNCGIIVHPHLQYLGCTPDGLVGEDAVLEVKCPFSAANKIISPESIQYLYLCEESGQFKLKQSHEYYYQIQGQLLCTNRKRAYFTIYTIADMHIIEIERDECFIKDMLDTLTIFYNEFFKEQLLNIYLYHIK